MAPIQWRGIVFAALIATTHPGCDKNGASTNGAGGGATPSGAESRQSDEVQMEEFYRDSGSLSKVVEEMRPGVPQRIVIYAEGGSAVMDWEVQLLDAFTLIHCSHSNRLKYISHVIRDKDTGEVPWHGLAAVLGDGGAFDRVWIYDRGVRVSEYTAHSNDPDPTSSDSIVPIARPSDGCDAWVLKHPVTSNICDSTKCHSTDSYYPSGKVKRRDIYCDDIMVHSVWFMPSGLPVLETAWGDGQHGMNFELNDGGRLVMFEQIRSGVRHGSRVTLDGQGRFATVKYFENGQLINMHDFEYD